MYQNLVCPDLKINCFSKHVCSSPGVLPPDCIPLAEHTVYQVQMSQQANSLDKVARLDDCSSRQSRQTGRQQCNQPKI